MRAESLKTVEVTATDRRPGKVCPAHEGTMSANLTELREEPGKTLGNGGTT